MGVVVSAETARAGGLLNHSWALGSSEESVGQRVASEEPTETKRSDMCSRTATPSQSFFTRP